MRKLLLHFIEPYVMELVELIRMLFASRPSDYTAGYPDQLSFE